MNTYLYVGLGYYTVAFIALLVMLNDKHFGVDFDLKWRDQLLLALGGFLIIPVFLMGVMLHKIYSKVFGEEVDFHIALQVSFCAFFYLLFVITFPWLPSKTSAVAAPASSACVCLEKE